MMAASALRAWGERGLGAIVESVIRSPTGKNISIALQCLAKVSAGEGIPRIEWLFTVDVHTRIVGSLTNWPEMAKDARRHLHALILSISNDDDITLSIPSALTFLTLGGGEAAKHLFLALSTRWVAISTPILNAYADLMASLPDEESVFQSFFERHPQLLDPMAFQVWPKPDLHGAKEPDFVVRRTDNSYLVVEIETPAKSLVTGGNQMSAQCTQAVTQAMNYKSFLMERFPEAARTFPEFREPECLVVIGLESNLNPQQKTALRLENQHRAGLKIVGFDWIASRAQTVSQNIIESRVDVQRIRMV